jgi:hypothetical protein
MPLRKNEDCGTDADGSKSEDYCFHCFKDGKFLDEGISLQQKIEKNVRFAVQAGMPGDEARDVCETILPQLKRWRKE